MAFGDRVLDVGCGTGSGQAAAYVLTAPLAFGCPVALTYRRVAFEAANSQRSKDSLAWVPSNLLVRRRGEALLAIVTLAPDTRTGACYVVSSVCFKQSATTIPCGH